MYSLTVALENIGMPCGWPLQNKVLFVNLIEVGGRKLNCTLCKSRSNNDSRTCQTETTRKEEEQKNQYEEIDVIKYTLPGELQIQMSARCENNLEPFHYDEDVEPAKLCWCIAIVFSYVW